jgi:PII-like signaling protein
MKTTLVTQRSGHVCGSRCRNGTAPAELAKSLGAAVERGVQAALATRPGVGYRGESSLSQEVVAELKKHPGVVAAVDEERGIVRLFKRTRNFDEQLTDLRARVTALADELAQAEANARPWVELERLRAELDAARRELDQREDAGRRYERQRQRLGGDDVPQRPQ